jgi:hypothetical protein
MRNHGAILRQGWEGQAGELDQGFEMPLGRRVENEPELAPAARHRRKAGERDQSVTLGDAGELGARALQRHREPVEPDEQMGAVQETERIHERNGTNQDEFKPARH